MPLPRSSHAGTVVALDVGGTAMKGALVDADGAVRGVKSRATGAARGPAAVVASVLSFAAELAEGARADGANGAGEAVGADAPGPAAAGIAVPGLIDEASGTARYAVNLGWRDVPLGELAAERLGLPVALGHDVRTGGLAEAVLGAGRGCDFLFVPVGTGIAAAAVIGGRPYAGDGGASGELGHVTVRPGGEWCACGRRGCLEAYASAAAVARRGGGTAEEVIARAAGGDPRARAVWHEALDALADGLAEATLLLDPGLIVLGGGLGESGDALLVPLAERLAERLPFRPAPPLERAALGALATLHGAALLARTAAVKR